MNKASGQHVAEWMATEVKKRRRLYQEEAARKIKREFGNDFVYINANGSFAIDKKVLAEFRKLTKPDVVWVKEEFFWRLREPHDDPGKGSPIDRHGEKPGMCTLIGLAFNLVGTVMVAFTFKKGKVVAWQETSGQMESMVQYRRGLFRAGIGIIFIGFLFQFIGAWPQD